MDLTPQALHQFEGLIEAERKRVIASALDLFDAGTLSPELALAKWAEMRALRGVAAKLRVKGSVTQTESKGKSA